MTEDLHDLYDLRLRDYRPVPRLVGAEHPVERARFPAVDVNNHLGRWLTGWVDRPGAWSVPDVDRKSVV